MIYPENLRNVIMGWESQIENSTLKGENCVYRRILERAEVYDYGALFWKFHEAPILPFFSSSKPILVLNNKGKILSGIP